MRAEATSYGSDPDGLIWGYRFAAGRPGEPVGASQALALLASPATADSDFFWLHFALSNSGSEAWLRANLDLPANFFDSLHSVVGSTRLEQDGEFLLAVIHDVLFGSSLDSASGGASCLCIGPRFLISARLRPLHSLDQLRTAVRAGRPFSSSIDLLAHLLRHQASVLTEILRQSSERVDEVEDGLLVSRLQRSRGDLGALRRTLVRLQRLLAPEPAAFFRLLNRPPPWASGEALEELRQSAEELAAAVSDSATLVERVRLIQEELSTLMAEQTNRTLYTLTVVTVLALPINLVAGLFGMNVGGVPLSAAAHGFGWIVVCLIGLTVLLAYLAFGRGRE